VVGEQRDDVQVDAKRSFNLKKPKLVEQVRDGKLVLDGDCGFWGDVGAASDCSTSFEVHVPETTPVTVKGSSGGLDASNLRAPLELASHSGDVTAQDVEGPLRLSTDAGDIRVDGFRGNTVTALTSSGDVEVNARAIPGHVTATSSAGDVTVVVPQAVYDVDAASSAGDEQVDVDQSRSAARRIEARTAAGDVRVLRLDEEGR
jgi:DUF4097 and DUF4098 domain-containing protein YvlB